MYAPIWQTGLDIQTDEVRALAIISHRHEWQLCHWWQQSLPVGVLCNGNLQQPEILGEILRSWRTQLPQNISLRIAFPAQRILQQVFPAPDKRLKEPERSWFINTTAARQFPLNSQILTYDYRYDPSDNTELRVTAARQDELQLWQNCLQLADLTAQVIDITPCALQCMACAAKLLPQHLLIHRLQDEYLWVSPLNAPFRYGVIPPEQENSVNDMLDKICTLYYSGQNDFAGIYYSSVIDEPVPNRTIAWSPFSIFQQIRLPLPVLPMAFVLAGGLAVRAMDTE